MVAAVRLTYSAGFRAAKAGPGIGCINEVGGPDAEAGTGP